MAKEISVELTRLFDLYAPLLSDKRRQAFEYYYFDDLSLGEIAELQGVSRQAVLESIRRGEQKLCGYEESLGFLKRLSAVYGAAEKIEAAVSGARISASDGDDCTAQLDRIADICRELLQL